LSAFPEQREGGTVTFKSATLKSGACSKAWRWLALAGCVAVAAMLCHPQEASARRRGGGSSLFVNTPYGLVPKSVMYGQYMSPQALQQQQAAEQKAMKKMQSAYNKRMGITTPKTASNGNKGTNKKKN
jgi:hypothetical protein